MAIQRLLSFVVLMTITATHAELQNVEVGHRFYSCAFSPHHPQFDDEWIKAQGWTVRDDILFSGENRAPLTAANSVRNYDFRVRLRVLENHEVFFSMPNGLALHIKTGHAIELAGLDEAETLPISVPAEMSLDSWRDLGITVKDGSVSVRLDDQEIVSKQLLKDNEASSIRISGTGDGVQFERICYSNLATAETSAGQDDSK